MRLSFLLPLYGFLALLADPARATPFVADFSNGPVVFDFEDGFQGWEPAGTAQRVSTQILGGHTAVFGDGLRGGHLAFETAIRLDIDLTDVAAIEFDQFFAGDTRIPGRNFPNFLHLGLGDLEGGGPLLTSIPDDSANPGRRRADLSDFEGIRTVSIEWVVVAPVDGKVPADLLVGFIDNITLVPIPEPSTLALCLLGVAGAAATRRARRCRWKSESSLHPS